jgi:hypothetical protein
MDIVHKYGGEPSFSPQFVMNVFDVLAEYGGEASLQTVEELLAPENPTLFSDHIQLAVRLGLFETQSGLLSAPESSVGRVSRLSPKTFSRFLRDVLIKPEIPNELNSLQGLFLWAYSILPLHDIGGRRTSLIPKKWQPFEIFGISSGLIGEGLVMKGDTQFAPTRRWLEALGVVVDMGKDSYALSYELMTDEILEMFNQSRVPIREFTEKVRSALPYLPGGQWNKTWNEIVQKAHVVNQSVVCVPRPDELTEIESVVLNYLRNRGEVYIEDRNDAGDRMKMSIAGSDAGMITHVEFKKLEISK